MRFHGGKFRPNYIPSGRREEDIVLDLNVEGGLDALLDIHAKRAKQSYREDAPRRALEWCAWSLSIPLMWRRSVKLTFLGIVRIFNININDSL